MTELLTIWSDLSKPSAGLPIVQWALLLALASASGYLLQRHAGLPKVVGYSLVGGLAGLLGFTGAAWPLQGAGLFLLELGVAVVLFEAGGRIPLRWFRHNPMVLVQSLAESALTFWAVYSLLRWLDMAEPVAEALALLAMAGSPAVLARVIMDTRGAGPVSERAMVLVTLSSFYALVLCTARAGLLAYAERGGAVPEQSALVYPLLVLALSVALGAALALTLRLAFRMMSPSSENTAVFLLAMIAAAATLAAHFGGSAPLAALLGGVLLKHLHARPWSWPRQMGTASAMLTMLMFVLVSVVAAQGDWSLALFGWVGALVAARAVAKVVGVGLGNIGSGASWTQALWVGFAMSPMSSVTLLLVSQFAASSRALGGEIASIALPAILLMEVLGAVLATVAIHRAGESARPWRLRSAHAGDSDGS
jgi:Kef-type K+ transport system membrane component KefB